MQNYFRNWDNELVIIRVSPSEFQLNYIFKRIKLKAIQVFRYIFPWAYQTGFSYDLHNIVSPFTISERFHWCANRSGIWHRLALGTYYMLSQHVPLFCLSTSWFMINYNLFSSVCTSTSFGININRFHNRERSLFSSLNDFFIVLTLFMQASDAPIIILFFDMRI